MWTVAYGSPFNDGLRLVGVFTDREAAIECAKAKYGISEWWIVEIEAS